MSSAPRGASAFAYAARLKDRVLHGLRGNSRKGARNNIEAHYDLGNDFYRLRLDETMAYSGALVAEDDAAESCAADGVRDFRQAAPCGREHSSCHSPEGRGT